MTPRNGITRITIASLLMAVVMTGRAAICIPAELQEAAEAGRIREMNLQAEVSLREKIEAGEQRYQEQLVFRKELIQGMASSAQERREEIAGTRSIRPVEDVGYQFDSTTIAWALILCGIVYQGVRFYRNNQLGDLDFGLHVKPAPAIRIVAPVVEKTPEPDWREFVNSVHLPPINEAHSGARARSGGSASVKTSLDISVRICLDISPSLKSAVSEDRVKLYLQNLFEPYGIQCDDNSKVWLALVIQGSCQRKATFSHAEKLVIFEGGSLSKKGIPGGAVTPVVLWGAEHTGSAEQAELERGVFTVLQVFAEMFLDELVASQLPAADQAPEVGRQLDAVGRAAV